MDNVRRLGARVILFGDDFDAAKEECLRIRDLEKCIFVPPFDDKYVIAGQGTVGVEILRQLKVIFENIHFFNLISYIQQDHLTAIFVCCGGGLID